MYLAQQNNSFDKTIYMSIFKELSQGHGKTYKKEIDTALFNYKKIKSGELSIKSINNEYFFLTMFLMEEGDNLHQDIIDEQIDNVIYNRVFDILEQTRYLLNYEC